jgi:uncharacterized protein YjbI with pentapeptide repeats
LRAANLLGADQSGAQLSHCNLGGARRSGDRIDPKWRLVGDRLLGGARRNLRGADLREACLAAASLAHARLRDADLSGASLTGADLRGAN